MSGETEAQVSAWTIDSLRSHFEVLLKERDLRYKERFDASQVALQTALAEREKAIQIAFSAQEAALAKALTGIQNLYDTVLKERDQRYEQRHQATQQAVEVALATVNKEFHEHISRVRQETIVAMTAAEKAINKAEIATEKRFDAVNEFRGQQADMITTFARKSEVDARFEGLAEKVDGCQAQAIQLGGTTLPRAEYDRAHTDLAERVIQVERGLNEKLEAQLKAFEARIALLQAQVSNVEAITR